MNTVTFDYAIDMTDSSVFSQGFWDDKGKYLYLVFENGTTAVRNLPNWRLEDVQSIESWGRFWNAYLKGFVSPLSEPLGNAQFVQRDTTPAEEAPVEETAGSETAYSFDEEAGTLTPDEDDESDKSAGPFTAQAQDALLTVSIDFDTERLTEVIDAGTEFLASAQDTVAVAVGSATDFVTGLFDRVRGNK